MADDEPTAERTGDEAESEWEPGNRLFASSGRLQEPVAAMSANELGQLLLLYATVREPVARGLEPLDVWSLDFSGAHLGGSFDPSTQTMGHCPDLRNAMLAHLDMRKGDANSALLMGASLDRASLRGACFAGAHLSKATLRGADLREVDFSFASLQEADLGFAAVDGANFDGANLEGTVLNHLRGRPSSMKGCRLDWRAVASGLHFSTLVQWVNLGVLVVDLERFPDEVVRMLRKTSHGLTLTFDRRLQRFDPTAFDALIAEVLGCETDVTIEERSSIDIEGPAYIRINGSRPGDLANVASAFYDRVWRSAVVTVEERAIQRAMSAGMSLLFERLDEIRTVCSGATLCLPGVAEMLTDQASTHALTKAEAARRIEELATLMEHERGARRALEHLIAGIIAPSGFRSWVCGYFGSEITDSLPGQAASPAEVVASFVSALDRRGLLDANLFEVLADCAPTRRDVVAMVAEQWGFSLRTT